MPTCALALHLQPFPSCKPPTPPLCSIAGREFTGRAIQLPIPNQAAALARATAEAGAAGEQPTQQQLARRAAEHIAERRRCVVVPVQVLRLLLQARVSIIMG